MQRNLYQKGLISLKQVINSAKYIIFTHDFADTSNQFSEMYYFYT